MKNSILLIVIIFLSLGLAIPGTVVADDHDEEDTEESDEEKEDEKDDEDELENDSEDESENESELEIEREIENGKQKTEVEKEFVGPNGTEKKVDVEIETENNGSKDSKREIKFKSEGGESEVEIENDLEIGGNASEKSSELSVEFSGGKESEINILPGKASENAKRSLGTQEIDNIEIEKEIENGSPKAVYHAKSNKSGNFLGLFDSSYTSSAKIDAETGKVVDKRSPWWSFFVFEANDSSSSIDDESNESTINKNGTDSREGLEIKAETYNETSKVEIELDFSTDSNKSDVPEEIIQKLDLNRKEISEVIELESGEEVSLEERFETEYETERNITSVELDWRFPINSTNKSEIISKTNSKISQINESSFDSE
ncbi:MAG: hypothetical protein ABEI74_00520 [Candidatus Pacearchaeota archaeon]